MARKRVAKKPSTAPRYAKFARHWVETGNATAAAIAAGYAKSRAKETGCELLRHPDVQAEIAKLQKDVAAAAGITPVMVARELAAIAFSDIPDYISHDGNKLSVFDLAKCKNTRAIAEVSEGADGRIKVKLHDKKGALDSLNKMLGFNAVEKQELTLNKSHEEALDELS